MDRKAVKSRESDECFMRSNVEFAFTNKLVPDDNVPSFAFSRRRKALLVAGRVVLGDRK
jgi:hypothetical protein